MLRRKIPRTTDVVATAPGVLTPRIVMQRCSASMMTSTPFGCRVSMRQSATSLVSRSCNCGLREHNSTTRATLLSPTILPLGRYAMCALPRKGRRWCSQTE